MTTDRLFGFIERLQGSTEWGRFLDAGTGRHSLQWVSGLKTRSWTAVTGDPLRAQSLTRKFSRVMRPADQVVAGNWQDAAFLHGERYDVVLADYLLGAIDGFAPPPPPLPPLPPLPLADSAEDALEQAVEAMEALSTTATSVADAVLVSEEF